MSLLTGPGRNSEMSVMMSSKVSMPDLPTSSRWPGDSIWKTPRVLACEIIWKVAGVVERHLRLVVEVDRDAVDAARSRSTAWAIEDCIRMPSTSSLSRPRSSTSSLSNWLIGKPGEAGLDRGAVEQGGVGEQHPARVHGDVAGQPVEPLDQPEHQVEPLARRARWPAARAGRAAPSGRRGPGCAGTPWRSRRSRPAACRARRRRRGPRGGRGRCPSSRRTTQRSPP